MRALLLIDIQNDFLPGGSLAVASGDEVVPVANRLIPNYEVIFATQDWHPADHRSFASQHSGKEVGSMISLEDLDQILWPDHCIQGSTGAEFSPELNTDGIQKIVQKGTDQNIDSYSGFFDNARRKETELAALLRGLGVKAVDIVGLATDYCVKFTALDAVDLGFETTVIREGVRGVNLSSDDCDRAFAEMEAAGVTIRS